MEDYKKDSMGDTFDSFKVDGINLIKFFSVIWVKKNIVICISAVSILCASIYIYLTPPIYQATAMIQIEDAGSSLPGLDDMAGLFQEKSEAVTEIQLLKSRRVIGEAVDSLLLDVEVTPKLFPIVGNKFYRDFIPTTSNVFAFPKLGLSKYAWGGESIDVFRFDIPEYMIGKKLTIQYLGDGDINLLHQKKILLKGKIGESISKNGYNLTVRSVSARPETEFEIIRKNRLYTIIQLQKNVFAKEKGRDSGIIDLSYASSDSAFAKELLDCIASVYVRQNIERNSAETQKSLDFLRTQLPEVKKQLEESEEIFNNYQVKQQSVDITLETQGVLEQIVELETKLQELELKRLEMSRRFKQDHPLYKGVTEQLELIKEQKKELSSRISSLPETQQELLRYTRDVAVNSEIYTMLLTKAQELDIMRAGAVGNVRIIDHAAVNLDKPVAPRKVIILLMSAFSGLILSVAIILIRRMISVGIEDLRELEDIGIPVYSVVPKSIYQSKENKKSDSLETLAIKDPTDLSIEALRSLRTSLHFAFMDSDNNVISISGPSPNVGKSFIASNLAVIIARSDKRVLLIDGDMRRGDLQESLGLNLDNGLADYLSGQDDLNDIIFETEVEGLDFITKGTTPPNPSELLMHHRFSDLIHYASNEYDFVIIDTPPILAVTDAAIIGNTVSCTLMVAAFGMTNKRELELSLRRFSQNKVNVKGLVFNKVIKTNNMHYGYGYYNYSY